MTPRPRASASGIGVARLLALAALLPLLAGCRVGVTADATIDARGGGELAVRVRIDGATLRELDALGIDPGLEVAAALDPASGWRSSREVDADGGLVLTHQHAFRDGAELSALFAALAAEVAPDDPALRLDVRVATDRRGAVALVGRAGLSPPGTAGLLVDGVPVGPAGAELAAATAAAVQGTLRVAVPGPVLGHDGDRASGGVVEWDLPVGSQRPVRLESGPAGWWRLLPLGPLLGVLAGAGGAMLIGRRLRARRTGAAAAAAEVGSGG